MKVISAFFADRATIHEEKLHVWGGVWDFYSVKELPSVASMDLAIITQLGSPDRGKVRVLTIAMNDPSGKDIWQVKVECNIAHDYLADHLCFAFTLAPTFETTGRHVTLLQVEDDITNAFAIPLSVRQDL